MSLASGNKVSQVLVEILYLHIGLVADVKICFGWLLPSGRIAG